MLPLLLYPSSLAPFPETTTIVSSRSILYKSWICKYKWVCMCVCTCVWYLHLVWFTDENGSLLSFFSFIYIYIYISIFSPFLSHMVAGCSLCFFHLLYLCNCVMSIHLGAALLFLVATSQFIEQSQPFRLFPISCYHSLLEYTWLYTRAIVFVW